MKTNNVANNILLESGTNELEIVEFSLGAESYGINVTKVREIIRVSSGITPVPDAHPSVVGVINLRGKIVPVIDLAKHLNIEAKRDSSVSRIIIADFNKIVCGFWVDTVTRIHRLTWQQVEAPSGLIKSKLGYVVGVIKIKEQILFLLDFEKLASVISPESGMEEVRHTTLVSETPFDRKQKKVLVVEDSSFISDLLMQHIAGVGYQVEVCKNGVEAWEALSRGLEKDKNILKHYQLMVTDIEMPQMDGLHLIKKVKETQEMKSLPCIVFSSMISPEVALKCRAVGADGQITKPEIDGLVELVDQKVAR